jgi:ubiquinone/menaquinone biosynthesis C-methylase UbiE
MGGAHFAADEALVSAARADVEKLRRHTGLAESSRLLDFGCGAGRLAIGIAEVFGRIGLYLGIDVQEELISWARRTIGSRPGFDFALVDAVNERYNPDGVAAHRLPCPDGGFDVVYAYSVFSHMRGADVEAYLGEFARVLAQGGRAYLTAFVEDGVTAESVNPFGYGRLFWLGKLHCVRYERQAFEGMLAAAGFEVVHFEHGVETDGQSLYAVRRLPATADRRS